MCKKHYTEEQDQWIIQNRDKYNGKQLAIEFEKQFGVRFFVKGNPQKFRDVEVYIIPLENIKSGYAQGYDRWNAQKRPLA